MAIHLANGVPLKSLFKPYIEVEEVNENTSMIVAHQSAVFSNWIPFRRQIEQIGLVQKRNLIIDVSNTKLVDHSVMEKLDEMQRDFEQEGLTFEVRGLNTLRPLADDAHAARKGGLAKVRRITIVAEESLEDWLIDEFVKCGATGYTSMPCFGAGRRQLENGYKRSPQVRIEVIAPAYVCNKILDFLRRDILDEHRFTACVETVDVVNVGHFTPIDADRPVEACALNRRDLRRDTENAVVYAPKSAG